MKAKWHQKKIIVLEVGVEFYYLSNNSILSKEFCFSNSGLNAVRTPTSEFLRDMATEKILTYVIFMV